MTRPDRLTLAAAALIAAHFLCLAAFHQPALSGPDAGGYFAQAKVLAREGHTYREPASPLAFVGPHWLDAGDGRYYSKYPPGFPLLLAIPYRLFGPASALWVDPLLASGALIGLFLLARLWVGPGWALLATAWMATNPLVNEHAVAGFSHTCVAFLLVWGLYALERWTRTGSWHWLAVAGLCAGTIPTARYAEVLYAGAFAVYVLLHLRGTGRPWRAGWPGLVTAAAPMALLALRNQLAFGAFWRTGYAISGEQSGFGLGYFAQHWGAYLEALGGPGAGPLFALGAAGIALLVATRPTRCRGLLMALLLVPTTLLYMAYYWGGGAMSQRFLLPTYYVYALGAVWLLKSLADHLGRPGLAAAGVVALLTLPWGASRSLAGLAARSERDAVLATVTDSLAQHVPEGAIVLADRALGQHLDVLTSWRLGHAEALLAADGVEGRGPGGQSAVRRFGPDRRGGPPEMGPPGGEGADGGQPRPMAGGDRERLGVYRALPAEQRRAAVLNDLRQWARPGDRAYVLVPGGRVPALLNDLDVAWRVVAQIDLPEPKTAAGGPGNGGHRRRRPGGGLPGPGGPLGRPPTGPVVLVELQL